MTENELTPDAPALGAKAVDIPEIAKVREQEFVRFSLLFRLQHMGLFTGVIILIITGLPLKYPDSALAAWFFPLVGGVTASGVIHRIGAALLIAVGTFHMYYITATREGRREFLHLLPKPKDFADVFKNVMYFFGFSRTGPKFARYSYIEKFDYWAVYWGMVVMIGSGLMLWFHEQTMAWVPKIYLDVAREAHSDEALLATLAIVVWHFYNVHFSPRRFPMSWTWLNGRISREEMIHEHPLEYEQITGQSPDGERERRPHGGNGEER